MVIYLVDAVRGIGDADRENLERLAQLHADNGDGPRLLRVYSKCDLVDATPTGDGDDIAISTVSGSGIDALIDRITGAAQDYVRAYAWYDISAARGHEHAGASRRGIVQRMSAAQVADAERLSRKLARRIPRAVP